MKVQLERACGRVTEMKQFLEGPELPLKEPVEEGFQEEGGWEPGLSREGLD